MEIAAKRWLATTRRNKKLREERAEDEKDFETLPPLHTRARRVSHHEDDNNVNSRLLQHKASFGTFTDCESYTCVSYKRLDTDL